MKRKESHLGDEPSSSPKKRRLETVNEDGEHDNTPVTTPSKRRARQPAGEATPNGKPARSSARQPGPTTPTPKGKGKVLFSTPVNGSKKGKNPGGLNSVTRNADRSAKRKSARVLLEPNEDDEWDGGNKLAQEIWDAENSEEEADVSGDLRKSVEGNDETTKDPMQLAETPKRGRGRPKGAKNKRSPTPDGDLPAHEKYFFQNRAGPPRTSNNTLSKVSLLTHEEYFEQLEKYADPHQDEKEFLLELHQRSFPQWRFELSEGYNICLYGYGAKRRLVNQFAEWLYPKMPADCVIVIVNGYTSNLTVRSILATMVSGILGADTPSKLGSQPAEVLEFLQSTLESKPPHYRVTLLINSIDSPALRRPSNQSILARIAALPAINMLTTADTPNFSLMWDISLRDQFNFVFHDCTTFASFETEVDVVDDVHNLLGRKARRIGGKDGVTYVLKSLTENARSLYRILISELLTSLGDHMSDDENEGGGERGGGSSGDEPGVEYRQLYQKASEEFVASNEMQFRTLLKEFYDHQMISSRVDPNGTELLGVPLSKEEMEGVLEDLVLG